MTTNREKAEELCRLSMADPAQGIFDGDGPMWEMDKNGLLSRIETALTAARIEGAKRVLESVAASDVEMIADEHIPDDKKLAYEAGYASAIEKLLALDLTKLLEELK